MNLNKITLIFLLTHLSYLTTGCNPTKKPSHSVSSRNLQVSSSPVSVAQEPEKPPVSSPSQGPAPRLPQDRVPRTSHSLVESSRPRAQAQENRLLPPRRSAPLTPPRAAPNNLSSIPEITSEAEMLRTYFLRRAAMPVDSQLDSVMLNEETIHITNSDVPRPYSDGYIINDQQHAANILRQIPVTLQTSQQISNSFPLTITYEQWELLDSSEKGYIQENVGFGDVDYLEGEFNPLYHFRPINPNDQLRVNELIARVDARIEELNQTNRNTHYFQRPRFRFDSIALYHEVSDGEEFEKLLTAVSNRNEDRFIRYLVLLATTFGQNYGAAKRGLIDTMSYLYVTQKFPSIGLRQKYLHYILQCGHIY